MCKSNVFMIRHVYLPIHISFAATMIIFECWHHTLSSVQRIVCSPVQWMFVRKWAKITDKQVIVKYHFNQIIAYLQVVELSRLIISAWNRWWIVHKIQVKASTGNSKHYIFNHGCRLKKSDGRIICTQYRTPKLSFNHQHQSNLYISLYL